MWNQKKAWCAIKLLYKGVRAGQEAGQKTGTELKCSSKV